MSQMLKVMVFVVGVGKIARTTLRQIRAIDHRTTDMFGRPVQLDIAGLAEKYRPHGKVARMAFEEDGSPLDVRDPDELLDLGDRYDLQYFLAVAKRVAGSGNRVVVVDTTAGMDVVVHVPELLRSSVGFATPNKPGFGGSAELYSAILKAESLGRGRVWSEGIVGAGMGFQSALRWHRATGTKIHCVEVIPSGTISFVFNSMSQGMSFSAAVRKAQAEGFCEPNPANDFNLKDIWLKSVILHRAGWPGVEPKILLEPLVSEAALAATNVDEFLSHVSDHEWANRVARAAKEQKRPRYIVSLTNGSAHGSIQSVGQESTAYWLHGPENLMRVKTDEHFDRWAEYRGDGAGPEVTGRKLIGGILEAAGIRIS